MALVDPNIALSYRGIQLQDPLDQYSKASAAQLNALQMDKFMRDRDALKQIQAAITAKGGPPDLESAANEMIRSGIPEYMTQGISIRQKVQETKAWEDYQKRFLAPKTQVSEESAAPTTPPVSAISSPFQANMLDNRQNLPLNRLMPSVEAPAAPAPQASKTPVVSSQQQRLADLEEEIAMLSGIDTPKAKARQQVLLRQLEAALKPEANRPIPLSPGQVLYSPTGQRIATAPEKPEKPPTPTELQRLINESDALPAGDPRRSVYEAAIKKATTHSPGTTVTVSTEKAYGSAFGGKLADVDIGKLTTAENAPALAENANRIISLVQQGNLFTGPIADVKLNIARALNVAGASNQEKIANTEALIAATGQSTLNAIKGAGLGTGQGFTDKDLKFLQGVAGGTINLTQQTLTELAKLQHKAAQRSAESWNKRSKEIPPNVIQGTGLSTSPISVPPLQSVIKKGGNTANLPPAPQGVDAAIWNVMTDKERALWPK